MPTEIYKFDGTTWQPITELTYNDNGTDRTLTEVHYNDAGIFRQVFGGAVAAETLAWDASAPTGSYDSLTAEVGGLGNMSFRADTAGGFVFLFIESISGGSTGTPTSGTFRPGVTGIDFTSYEISINTGAVVGSGTKVAIGAGTLLDGTFQNLDVIRGVQMKLNGTGTGSISVTVEIREILTPSNTTGAASFTLRTFVS